eukprot:2104028-Lingulodinium_polyedra.AAC.1
MRSATGWRNLCASASAGPNHLHWQLRTLSEFASPTPELARACPCNRPRQTRTEAPAAQTAMAT